MFDGKYNASINTPMGPISGTITLVSKGNEASGMIETMGMRNNFQGSKVSQNQGKFTGKFNTPIGAIDYNATCTVNNNELELIATTNKGNFKIIGKRM